MYKVGHIKIVECVNAVDMELRVNDLRGQGFILVGPVQVSGKRLIATMEKVTR